MERGPRRRRLDPSARRQQLLDAGLDLLDRTGERPSTKQIAERAQVTPGLLYRYFPDQHAYHLALLEQVAASASAATRWPERAFADALRDSLRAQIDFAARHPGRWRALLAAPIGVRARWQEEQVERLLSHRAGPASPRVRLLVRGWVGFCQSALEAWLDQRDLPPAELASLLAATLEPTLAVATDKPKPPRQKPRVRLLGAARPPTH